MKLIINFLRIVGITLHILSVAIVLMIATVLMSSCSTSHVPYNKHVAKVQRHKKPACYRVTGYTRIF